MLPKIKDFPVHRPPLDAEGAGPQQIRAGLQVALNHPWVPVSKQRLYHHGAHILVHQLYGKVMAEHMQPPCLPAPWYSRGIIDPLHHGVEGGGGKPSILLPVFLLPQEYIGLLAPWALVFHILIDGPAHDRLQRNPLGLAGLLLDEGDHIPFHVDLAQTQLHYVTRAHARIQGKPHHRPVTVAVPKDPFAIEHPLQGGHLMVREERIRMMVPAQVGKPAEDALAVSLAGQMRYSAEEDPKIPDYGLPALLPAIPVEIP